MENHLNAKNLLLPLWLVTAAVVTLCSCEQPLLDTPPAEPASAGEVDITLHCVPYVQEPFGADAAALAPTRSAQEITSLCSRLNIAVFGNDGAKVKTVSQKAGDANYGTVHLSLPQGSYKLVVIAHNCDGAATITSTDKVTFPNNKVSDTFHYYGVLEVGSQSQSFELSLTRVVAMFRLKMTDADVPSSLSKLKFYYLGGSSTFSPSAGYGIVQSKQTELRSPAADGVYEIYTMPHTEDDVLTKVTVTALDAADNVIGERVFEDVPVRRDHITSYSGTFFTAGGGVSSSGDLLMTAKAEWGGITEHDF